MRTVFAVVFSATLFALAALFASLELTGAAPRPWVALLAFVPAGFFVWVAYLTLPRPLSRD
jgi:hypothetical protein